MLERKKGRAALAAAAVGAVLALGACKGSGTSATTTTLTLTSAYAELGQADFTGHLSNRGAGAGAGTLSEPFGGVATDGHTFYVADFNNNRVLGYNSVPVTSGAAADFVLGQADFTSTTPAASSAGSYRLALPSKVFVGSGKLVVADAGNNRVLIWNSLPTSAATQPDVIVGQASITGNAAGTTASSLSYPTAAVIVGGKLIVADQNNNRVLIWNTVPSANGTAADLVLGQADFTTSTANSVSGSTTSGGATASNLQGPADVWSDGYRLLVADTGNNRVLYWSQFPYTTRAPANYVIGQGSLNYSGAGLSAASLHAPYGVSSDGNHIFVADTANNRVLVFNDFPIVNGMAAYSVFGQGDFNHNTANDDNQDSVADTAPTARTLNTPMSVATYNNTLFISDRSNDRIMLFSY